ncbi:hypothetical protein [Rhizobium sp. SAFR-030]|uniref:hypothetical protein n=1 Tax=Rhizobium sp. SAFR-030 TaxID=3387277 RepID=UPI003F8114A3
MTTGNPDLLSADTARALQLLKAALPDVERMAGRYFRSSEEIAMLTARTLMRAREAIRRDPAEIETESDMRALLFRIQHQHVQELLCQDTRNVG